MQYEKLFSSASLAVALLLTSYIPSFLPFLPQTLWQIWKELSYLFSFSIKTLVSRDDAADELAGRGAPLVLSAIAYSSGSQPFWRHYPNQGSEYALLPSIFHFVKEHNRASIYCFHYFSLSLGITIARKNSKKNSTKFCSYLYSFQQPTFQ